MRFTIAQVRSALGLPSQTLRYWRGVIEPLREKANGKAARFTFGEIVALAVLARLVNGLRIDVGGIAPMAPAIFELCRRPAFVSPHAGLVLDIEHRMALLVDIREPVPTSTAVVVIALFDVVQHVRSLLTEHDDTEQEQAELPLPLASVK